MDLQLDNLTIGYKGSAALASAVTATIAGGELTCLIGSNGIGKSTLLKTISGFIKPVEGRVLIGGRDIAVMTHSQRARSVSVVLTGSPSVQNLTVEEMVGLGRSPYTGFWGRLSEDDKRIVDEAISMVGIGRLRRRMIQTLSDGERQKTMIARALAQLTPVVLLDEPTAFLDYPSRVELMKLLHRLASEQGKTILLSTHDLDLAARIADSILKLSDNHLEKVDKASVRANINRMLSKGT